MVKLDLLDSKTSRLAAWEEHSFLPHMQTEVKVQPHAEDAYKIILLHAVCFHLPEKKNIGSPKHTGFFDHLNLSNQYNS